MEIKDIIQTEKPLYRLDKQQIEFLAAMYAEIINQNLNGPMPNLNRTNKGSIRHGLLKGFLPENGLKRTDYFQQILNVLTK